MSRISDGDRSGPEAKSFKEFALTSLAVRNATSVVVLFAFVTIAGLLAYRSIPKESFPEFEIPMIAVNTMYPGVAPGDVESLITRKIEEELNTIAELDELTSTSVEGYSSVIAEFQTSTNMDEALQKVREKVDLAKPELPAEAEDPSILEFNLSDEPIMQVNLAGGYGLVRLKELGEDLQERIESIPAVLRVDLRGGLERQVNVDVDLSRLQYYNVSLDDVIAAIRQENVNVPGGAIDVNGVDYLVRVDGEFDDPAVIGDLVVETFAGSPVYVRDLARVEFGFADRESYARLGEQPVVTLDVVKRSGENIIATADAVRAEIEAMRPVFPPSTAVSVTSDQSTQIDDMVQSLQNNIISGLLLIVGVLLFVLGLRTSVFVAISIPTSMFLSFVVLSMLGVSMNMVVLFSLILALGMLVDNAIVIVENIHRFVENGWDPAVAARKATGEVAVPVVAATATTLAAFAPLLFWPGMAGEFMKFLPLTLIVTLSSSLFVALVIVPTLCALLMRPDGEAPRRRRPAGLWFLRWEMLGAAVALLAALALGGPLTAGLLAAAVVGLWLLHARVLEPLGRIFMTRGMPRIGGWYEARLRWALNHRGLIVLGSVGALVGTVALYSVFAAPVEYFPEDIPPNSFYVSVEAPVGTAADVTNGYANRLYGELSGVEGLADAETVVSTVGSSGGGGGMMGGGGPGGPEDGRIAVSLTDYQDRRFDAFATLREMQSRLGGTLAGADVRVDVPVEGPATGPPINLEITGEDPVLLERLAEEAMQVVRDAPVHSRLVGLESDMSAGRPELRVEVDREKASLYGLSTDAVGFVVRGAVNGIEAAKYRTGNDEFDIVVRLREEDRRDLTSIGDLTAMADGQQVPLVSVARWSLGEGYGSIRRKDMDRVATVSSEVASGYNSNAVRAEVERVLAGFAAALPPGYSLEFTGEQQEQQEAAGFLARAFLAALMLIALILVSQFNSVIKPLIILSSVILSTIGVLIGLMVFQMPFVIIMTGVGVISLAGIVVNNAIVLIDYIDVLRRRDGLGAREAVILAGKTRMRPVLLTALTTALGLVPLAIGLNFDFFGLFRSLSPDLYWGGEQAAWWGPMAVAVIVGIVFATFLTLILLPVLYSLVDDLIRWARGGEERDESSPAAAVDLPARPLPEREPELDVAVARG